MDRFSITDGAIKARALVRAGATGARAPAEIWQRVPSTHPEKDATLLKSTKCSKIRSLNQDKSSLKVQKYQIPGT